MKNNANFPKLPDLMSIDFTGTSAVRELARERFRAMFGSQDDDFIDQYMDATESLFAGREPGFQPMDTAYHNITHTLQAALCLVELLHKRHLSDATPRISQEDFKRALVAALFHDIGYLRQSGDSEGSGAKYTHLHEKRSCDFARAYLSGHGWPPGDIQFVENLISATGPSADVNRIAFRSEIESTLGRALCTADYIGQMSDPQYPDKLEILFGEFRESYQYQQIPERDWPFASYEALLRSTPGFWNTFVQNKLNGECDRIWKHLEHPEMVDSPYMRSIARNMEMIESRIAAL